MHTKIQRYKLKAIIIGILYQIAFNQYEDFVQTVAKTLFFCIIICSTLLMTVERAIVGHVRLAGLGDFGQIPLIHRTKTKPTQNSVDLFHSQKVVI